MKSSSYRRSTKERNGIHLRHTDTQLKITYVHITKAVILQNWIKMRILLWHASRTRPLQENYCIAAEKQCWFVTVIVMGVRQSGQPRLWSCTALAHDSQKRWWPQGTSAKRASRGAMKQTIWDSFVLADTPSIVQFSVLTAFHTLSLLLFTVLHFPLPHFQPPPVVWRVAVTALGVSVI